MHFELLSVEQVVQIHDAVLNPGELIGLAGDKSLDGALSRVSFRIQYGLVDDVYDVAAMYAVAISQAHAFNDANKRTAYGAMKLYLRLHGIVIRHSIEEVGDLIIDVAQGKVSESGLASWLRTKAA